MPLRRTRCAFSTAPVSIWCERLNPAGSLPTHECHRKPPLGVPLYWQVFCFACVSSILGVALSKNRSPHPRDKQAICLYDNWVNRPRRYY